MFDKTKIIDVRNIQSNNEKEAFHETVLEPVQEIEPPKPMFGRSLWETANNTSQFPFLLQDGLRTLLFNAFNGTPMTYPMLTTRVNSDKEFETYLKDSGIGYIGVVPEGGTVPRMEAQVEGTKQVRNKKHEVILPVTWEMIRYDRTQVIRQQFEGLGRAMQYTMESDFYTALTTATNWARTTAAGDTLTANNTAATTFSAAGLETALGVLGTMKDRKSGQFLGISSYPLTLICAVELEWAAKQLLMNANIERGGDGVTTRLVYGTGTGNPFRGIVSRIVVSPHITSAHRYGWFLGVPERAMVYQEVEPLSLSALTTATDWTVHNQDTLEYKVKAVYGFDVIDDRWGYYSSSVTAATVA